MNDSTAATETYIAHNLPDKTVAAVTPIGLCVLIIAHRMRTIANANHIVVLKDGIVAEDGTPEELISRNGIYKHMCETQRMSAGWKM